MEATARIQRVLQVMRDGLLRRSEAALRWGDVEFHEDGSVRLNVFRFKTDQEGNDNWLFVGPEATADHSLSSRSFAFEKVVAEPSHNLP